jgi:hypothetical protein
MGSTGPRGEHGSFLRPLAALKALARVNAYVVKPVNFHEFVNAVGTWVSFWAVIDQPPPGSVKKVP